MRVYLLLSTILVTSGFVVSQALAGHIQNISHETAVSMCAQHGGGGTTCGYCDSPNHCHEIDCGEGGKGKCTNTVVTTRKVGNSGPGIKGPSGTTISGTSGTKTGNGSGLTHPVISPPASSGVNKGSSSGNATIERSGGGKH
jgi:hypothetical protein